MTYAQRCRLWDLQSEELGCLPVVRYWSESVFGAHGFWSEGLHLFGGASMFGRLFRRGA